MTTGTASPRHVRVPKPSTHVRPPTEFSSLLKVVIEAGLLHRRYTYYAAKIALTLGVLGGLGVIFGLLGDSWYQLLVAAALAIVLTHLAFLSHDAAHRQIFVSGKANDRAAVILANLGVGISVAWWTKKHTKHHAAPNQIGRDTDIDFAVLHFYPPEKVSSNPVISWMRARQGWWFFPILTVEGLNLHFQAFVALLGREPIKNRWTELSLVLLRLGGYIAALFLVLSPGKAVAFLAIQLAVFGVYMGCSFAPNHKGMPVLPPEAKLDFLRRQVLMSRNIVGTRFNTFMMGGLNFQIEHHLFPSMPRPNLRRAQALVRPFCQAQGVAYTETTLRHSYRIVISYLNKVGLGARDPFQCPLVAAARPRG
ncbi:acyl-CoA desaturase [Nakamurella antarctica]|uniref:Acyl-CoA desaturase n=1 Tax=Nakamurella antarctica TaxID=1902245 RepID=A0A3G8ZZY8_9ACTN|nr:acyl-CoA desaturase [Nakamurella antarctica]AZI59101.1 acyl-CoA desaturase [Nakamurella antarctica]